jgi:hypothetical protein
MQSEAIPVQPGWAKKPQKTAENRAFRATAESAENGVSGLSRRRLCAAPIAPETPRAQRTGYRYEHHPD